MRNRDAWQPSKYVYRNGQLAASRDRRQVGVGSRLIADLIAEAYDSSLRQHAKGKLLDLGCGNVPLFMAYKSYVTDNVCVDWDNTLHRNDYLDLQCDLTKALPFADGEFDTIVLSDVLEHMPEPDLLWTEMARLLSVGGRVLVSVPFYYWLHEQPRDYYRYTQFALRRFVVRSGLRVLQLDSMGGVPEIGADIFAKCVLRVPKVGPSLAMFAQWATKSLLRTKLGRKVSAATKDQFPFAYFLIAEKPALIRPAGVLPPTVR